MMDYISELKGTIMDHVDIGAVFEDLHGSDAVLDDDTITMLNIEVSNLKGMLNESVYIPITFSGITPFAETATADQSIAVRILYSYFMDKRRSTFDGFT
ncbi:hypothetical protein O9G_006314, partial [Rozella allomycis CSF55]